MYEIRERGHFGGGAPVPKGDCKRKTADARPEEQCCCKHLLADEPDFKAQPTALEELLVAFVPRCFAVPNHIFWFMG